VAAGGALPLAFAPWSWHLLAVLSLTALFWLWDRDPVRAGWRGALFGLACFGVGTSWVRESFQFSDVPAPAAIALTALLVAYLALFPAALGYLQARLFPRLASTPRLLLVLPAGWVLGEWLRGWLLTGFPWLLVGSSQTDSPLGGLAPIGGVLAMSWAVALSAAGLVALARGGWLVRGAVTALLVTLWAAGWQGRAVEWTSAAGEPRRVAVVQGNVAQRLKWREEERAATLAHYLALTRAHWHAHLVVWPETAVPAFAHRVQDFLAALAEEAEAEGSAVLLGIPYADPATGRYYNSVLALGGQPALYHKRHLVPFGEFVPFEPLLGPILDLLNAPFSDFSRGPAGQPPLEAAGMRLGVSICYEDAFGAEVIEALPEATVLVNVSNDAWFGDSIAPHQHQQIARVRAMETGRDLVRATNTGISALIDWRGRLSREAPQFQSVVIEGEVQPRTGATPYVRVGDLPLLLAALLALGVAGSLRSRPG
jgi:apolipoprotein N-acyltransferase